MITRRVLRWVLTLAVPIEWRVWASAHIRDIVEVAGGLTFVAALVLVDLRLGLVGLAILLIVGATFAGNQGGSDDGSS